MTTKRTTNPRELTARELKDVVGGGGGMKEIPGVKGTRRAKNVPNQPRRLPRT
jgi:hypothetical protein